MVDPASAAADVAGAKGTTRIEEPTPAQRTVARRSAESRATVPDLELSAEVDMGRCLALRQAQPCPVMAILVRACALALRGVPEANAAYRDGHYELFSRVNVGVTIETDDAYVIPTVFDADRKPLTALGPELDALAERARRGELTSPQLSGATFTLSNPGRYGVTSSTPVINPPQAAAIAAGAIRQVPVIRDGAILPGQMMTITLACDHRILYGAPAARFLAQIRSRIEEAAL